MMESLKGEQTWIVLSRYFSKSQQEVGPYKEPSAPGAMSLVQQDEETLYLQLC